MKRDSCYHILSMINLSDSNKKYKWGSVIWNFSALTAKLKKQIFLIF